MQGKGSWGRAEGFILGLRISRFGCRARGLESRVSGIQSSVQNVSGFKEFNGSGLTACSGARSYGLARLGLTGEHFNVLCGPSEHIEG